ncbi:MAG: UDP-N-acetylmuramoyl-tripeptide--D-alanyl-D-alanine ligase, partial [Armatimonadetes bacterium]|nr:UDP-N-acetylmuramoyl-tripeptide--D-alanyl-D-alanine ligase [Armatimonadota bacterium]
MRITLKQVVEATGGGLRGGDGTLEISGVSTDSRTLQPAELFVALPGERFDGHDFVPEAFACRAAAAVVERELPELSADQPLVIVEDALRAYGQLAGWYRNQFDVTVVAVTGSVGKTTTKNMIGSILA